MCGKRMTKVRGKERRKKPVGYGSTHPHHHRQIPDHEVSLTASPAHIPQNLSYVQVVPQRYNKYNVGPGLGGLQADGLLEEIRVV